MQYDVSVHMTVNLAANLAWQLDSSSFNFKVSHIHRANQEWEDSPSYQLPFSCDKGKNQLLLAALQVKPKLNCFHLY